MSELVTIKSSHSGIELRLNAELPFPDLLKAVEEKFRQSADFFKNAKMAVSFSGRTLSISEEEQLIQVITQTTNLEIICIIDHDERKELIYKRAVAQCLSEREKSDGQFYRGTLKRRQLLESESSIVILGCCWKLSSCARWIYLFGCGKSGARKTEHGKSSCSRHGACNYNSSGGTKRHNKKG